MIIVFTSLLQHSVRKGAFCSSKGAHKQTAECLVPANTFMADGQYEQVNGLDEAEGQKVLCLAKVSLNEEKKMNKFYVKNIVTVHGFHSSNHDFIIPVSFTGRHESASVSTGESELQAP